MNELQERAILKRIYDDPEAAISHIVHISVGYVGGTAYKELHPELTDDEIADLAGYCCEGLCMYDVTRCTCWEAVYDVEQQPPQPLGIDRLDHDAMRTRCSDCAFRRDSQERSDEYESEELLALPWRDQPFWCHSGMRRPARWVHPKLGEVPGDPSNWTPIIVDGIPYQADGQPGLLCAGWKQERARVLREREDLQHDATGRP